MEFGLSVAGALLFSGFIVFDTHMLIHKLSPEEYILAAINLYLDIINLFLEILKILNSAKKWKQLYTYSYLSKVVYYYFGSLE